MEIDIAPGEESLVPHWLEGAKTFALYATRIESNLAALGNQGAGLQAASRKWKSCFVTFHAAI
jgi:hypothetical protein